MFRSLRISNVEFRFAGPEKLGQSRNSRMEGNFRLFRFSGILGQPRVVLFAPQPGISGIFGRMESSRGKRFLLIKYNCLWKLMFWKKTVNRSP